MEDSRIFSNAMIIDDSEMDTFLLKHILSTRNYCEFVTSFLDPIMGLEFLEENEKNISIIPDIIFLDINMPLMNGFEFLEAFNKLSKEVLNKCKFVIISSSEDPNDIAKSKVFANVVSYLIKPIEAKELLRTFELAC